MTGNQLLSKIVIVLRHDGLQWHNTEPQIHVPNKHSTPSVTFDGNRRRRLKKA